VFSNRGKKNVSRTFPGCNYGTENQKRVSGLFRLGMIENMRNVRAEVKSVLRISEWADGDDIEQKKTLRRYKLLIGKKGSRRQWYSSNRILRTSREIDLERSGKSGQKKYYLARRSGIFPPTNDVQINWRKKIRLVQNLCSNKNSHLGRRGGK